MGRSLTVLLVLLASIPSLIQADEEAIGERSSQPTWVQGKHRLDLSLNRLDTGEDDVTVRE